MVLVAGILIGLGAVVWILLALTVFDKVSAWRYNRRKAKLRALNQAFAEGYSAALGEYAKQPVQTYRAVLVTPDRPQPDHYMEQVRHRIEALTGRQEAINYPRGS